MTDVATLGFEVKSDSLVAANEELQRTPKLAAAAEQGVEKLGKASEKAGDDAEKGAKKSSTASAKVLDDIRNEQAMIGKTALQIAISNNQRKAGVDAASAQGQAIANATKQLHEENAAIEEQVSKGRMLGEMFRSLIVSAAAFFAAKKFVEATSEADFAMAQLENTLRGVGQFAGQSKEKLKDWGEQLEKTTVFTTTAATEAQTMMLMFTRVRGDTFERAMNAAADLATVMKQDLGTAAGFVGKALQEPAKAARMLTAAGIELTSGQQKLIDGFVRSGEAAKAQSVILDAIERRMQGAAVAARETLGGALQALQNVVGDLFELPKEKSEPLRLAIEELVKAVSDPSFVKFAQTVGGLMFKSLENAVYIITLLTKAVSWLTDNGLLPLIDVFGSFGTMFEKAFGMTLIEAVKLAGNWIVRTFLTAYETIKSTFILLPDVIGIAITNALNAIIGALNDFIMGAWGRIQGLAAQARALNPFTQGQGTGSALGGGIAGDTIDNKPPGPIPIIKPNQGARDNVAAGIGGLNDRIKGIQSKDYMSGLDTALGRTADAADKADKPVRKLTDDVGKMKTNADAAGDAWNKLTKSAQDYIAKQELAAQTLGMGVEQAARLRHEQDLLAKATEGGRTVTAAQAAQIRDLAAAMAQADSKLATAKFMFDAEKDSKNFVAQQKMQADALLMSSRNAAALKFEFEMLNKAANDNIQLTPEQVAGIKQLAGAMADAQEQTNMLSEAIDFAKDTLKSFFDDLVSNLKQGQSVWQAFGNAAVNALDKILSKLLDMALNQVLSGLMGSMGGGGGGLMGLLGGLFGGGGGGAAGLPGILGSDGLPIGFGGFDTGIAFEGFDMLGMAALAGGGNAPVGTPYLVGEEGPEVRVDTRPGMIFNQDQWRRMSSAANGNKEGDTHVTIQQSFGPGVNVATKEEVRAMGRQVLGQIEGVVIRAKTRGGPIREALRSR